MIRYAKFYIDRDPQLHKKVIDYFARSGFKLIEQTGNSLKFKFSSFMLDTWVFNPLKWKSEIFVFTNGQEVEAQFSVNTSAQIVTAEVKDAWNIFIDNFREYVLNGIDLENVTLEAVKRARLSILVTIRRVVIGIAAGGVIGAFIGHFTGFSFLAYIGLILGANYSLTRRLITNRHKSAL